MVSKKVFRILIKEKGWEPYIKSYEINLGKARGYTIWTFKDHESFECRFKNGEKPQEV